ncbi:hypothetical protein ACXR6G_02860 [Ancylomarina sp. YFZ004]
MGDSDEELEVIELLDFLIGLSLVGDITGIEVNSEPLENPIGPGGQWVILDVLIQNVSDKDAIFSCQAENARLKDISMLFLYKGLKFLLKKKVRSLINCLFIV